MHSSVFFQVFLAYISFIYCPNRYRSENKIFQYKMLHNIFSLEVERLLAIPKFYDQMLHVKIRLLVTHYFEEKECTVLYAAKDLD